jgi:hypothetical protein
MPALLPLSNYSWDGNGEFSWIGPPCPNSSLTCGSGQGTWNSPYRRLCSTYLNIPCSIFPKHNVLQYPILTQFHAAYAVSSAQSSLTAHIQYFALKKSVYPIFTVLCPCQVVSLLSAFIPVHPWSRWPYRHASSSSLGQMRFQVGNKFSILHPHLYFLSCLGTSSCPSGDRDGGLTNLHFSL